MLLAYLRAQIERAPPLTHRANAARVIQGRRGMARGRLAVNNKLYYGKGCMRLLVVGCQWQHGFAPTSLEARSPAGRAPRFAPAPTLDPSAHKIQAERKVFCYFMLAIPPVPGLRSEAHTDGIDLQRSPARTGGVGWSKRMRTSERRYRSEGSTLTLFRNGVAGYTATTLLLGSPHPLRRDLVRTLSPSSLGPSVCEKVSSVTSTCLVWLATADCRSRRSARLGGSKARRTKAFALLMLSALERVSVSFSPLRLFLELRTKSTALRNLSAHITLHRARRAQDLT